MAKLTVRDLDVRGKRVFLRVDYNVPLEEKDGQMVITDATRIVVQDANEYVQCRWRHGA